MRDSAPPETPFLTSQNGTLAQQTPVVRRFNMLKPSTEAQNTAKDNKNVITGGVMIRQI